MLSKCFLFLSSLHFDEKAHPPYKAWQEIWLWQKATWWSRSAAAVDLTLGLSWSTQWDTWGLTAGWTWSQSLWLHQCTWSAPNESLAMTHKQLFNGQGQTLLEQLIFWFAVSDIEEESLLIFQVDEEGSDSKSVNIHLTCTISMKWVKEVFDIHRKLLRFWEIFLFKCQLTEMAACVFKTSTDPC